MLQVHYSFLENSRMLLQALWWWWPSVAPCFQPFAGVLPLFFPRVTIYYLQITGKYKPLALIAEPVDVAGGRPGACRRHQSAPMKGVKRNKWTERRKILYTIHTNIPVLGDLKMTQTLVSTWIVMALLSALAFWLGVTSSWKTSPNGRPPPSSSWNGWTSSSTTTWAITSISIIPLVGSIFALSIGCNLISVVGLWGAPRQT